MKNDYSGEEFLDQIIKNLFLNCEAKSLKYNVGTKEDKLKKISSYLERIEKIHYNANTDSKKEFVLNRYYKKYVIKKEYLKNFSLEEQDQIINAQKESLKSWINYLTDINSKYPMWAKYWAFQGMLKIGTYNEISNSYLRRRLSTTSPFIEANPAAIAECISIIQKYVKDKVVTDDNIKYLVQKGTFQKLYPIIVNRKKINLIKTSGIDGIWIKYNYGNVDDARKLCESLQGYNNPWCTCNLDYAISQVCGGKGYLGGDFYVYYTKDENNKYTYPRIAIRMDEYTKIGEIRGIDVSQNLEEGLEEIVKQQLDAMSFIDDIEKEKNQLAINDSKKLTKLNQQNDLITNTDSIKFLFEIERNIEGFGWEKDPRIAKLKRKIEIFDKDLILKIINRGNPYVLKYASNELKNDKDVVFAAVSMTGYVFNYASTELKNNKEYILYLIENADPYAIEYANNKMLEDKDIILKAINKNPYTLSFASSDLKNDKSIVLAAVKKEWKVLEYANPELCNDREIVIAAALQNCYALEYASKELQNDPEVINAILSQSNSQIIK